MCGITGIFHFDKQRKVDLSLLKKMNDLLDHRGPDGEGFFIENNIGLGHRRLSIIDLEQGSQPIYNQRKDTVIVLNGEIYNYIELKEELKAKGYQFQTNSDTEVVLKAYEEWGIKCQEKLNGMWAFAIWDYQKKQLFISRDRVGEKPLHYSTFNNSFVFASEIKSILEFGIPKEPQLELMELYAVFKNIPAPFTFFKHIFKLMPGHYIIVNDNGYKEEKYWDLPSIDEENMLSNTTQIHEEFMHLFNDSVKIRMRADVPFGAFLSGGLDSASIVAVMSKHTSLPINTFTIGYDQSEYDESYLANLVAQKFNTIHHLGRVDSQNFNEIVNKIIYHYDEPFGDSSAIPTGYVSKFAAQKVKMVLTGDGGDEVLSGYSTFQGIKFAQKYQSLPSGVQQFFPAVTKSAANLLKGSSRYKLNRLTHVLKTSSKGFNERLIEKQSKPGINELKKIFKSDIRSIKTEDYLDELMKKCTYKDDFYKQMYLNFKFDLPNDYLVKVDRMSMAYSLETRLPFLDFRLIEFMTHVNKNVKMKGWERKSVLRSTIAKELPPALLNAPKKGFRVPVREWFKSKELKDQLIKMSENSIFDSDNIKKIINDNSNGKQDHGNLLWSLFLLHKIV